MFPEDFGADPPRERGRIRRGLGVGARLLLTLIGLAALTLAAGSLLLTQTVLGRQAVASFVEGELDKLVTGDVEFGPILGGNLVSRVLLARFVIRDAAGEPFVELDSVRMEYNPVSLLLGTYRFSAVSIRRASLRLLQDSDGTWNYERIFAGDDGGGPGAARVLLTDLAVHEGEFEVRSPWDGPPGDEALWRILPAEAGGYERVIRLDSLSGLFPLVRIVDPLRPMRFEIEGLAARAQAVQQDHRIVRFDGSATFRDSVAVIIERLESPTSVFAGDGWVRATDPVQFGFDLQAEPLGFEDIQFLTVPLPDHGGGPAHLRLYTRPDYVMVTEVDDADIRVDESRMTGGFAIHLEDPPRFSRMALGLPRVRLSMVDDLLDREPLIDGVVTGTLSGRGPITLLDLEADLELADPPGVADPAAPSQVMLDGGLALVEPRLMADLRIEMSNFEPRWIRAVGIEPNFAGRATGTASLDGTAGERFAFTIDTDHVLATGERSSLTGSGTIDLSSPDRSMLDVAFDFQPLAVRAIDPWIPDPELRDRLRGEVRGPMSARGRLGDLRIVADFATPRGRVNFDGRFDLEAEEKTYDASLLAEGIQASQWMENGLETELAVEGRVVGTGTDPATLRARFDLTILPSLIEGARVDTSLMRFTLSEGLAVADTFAIRTDVGSVDGRGSFGLIEERSGSLILDISAPDLSLWNDWIVPGRNPAREAPDVSSLFAEFDVPQDVPEAVGFGDRSDQPAEPDTLAGRATALGVVYGNMHRFSFGGRVTAHEFAYAGQRADSLQLTVDVPNPRALDTVTVRLSAVDADVLGRGLDELGVRWDRRDAAHSTLEVSARRDTSFTVNMHTELDWTETEKRARIEQFDVRFGSRELTLRDTAVVEHTPAGFAARDVTFVGDGGGLIQLGGVVPDSGQVELDLAMRGIRLENALEIIGNPHGLAGELTFGATVRGTADAPLWDAHLDIVQPAIAGLGYDGLSADLSYSGRRLALGGAITSRGRDLARIDGFVRADLALRPMEQRLLEDPLNFVIDVDSMPLNALELGVGTIRDVTGYARGRVEVTGEPSALQFEGDTEVHRAAMFVPSLGVRLQGIEGRVVYAGSNARIDTLSIRSSAGGFADISGALQLADLRDVGFDLDFRATNFRGMDRRNARFRIDGAGELNGSFARPEFTGRLQLSEGDIRTDRFLQQQQAVDLSDPAIYALIDTTIVMEQQLFETTRNPFLQNMRMDAEIQVGPDLWLRSDAIEVELAGTLDVTMDQQVGQLAAFGSLNLLRGSFRYSIGQSTDITSILSRQLQIERGVVRFVGSPGMDPNLDIDAVFRTRSEIGPLEITVHVGGTSLSPVMTTSSNPPLPDSERICYLVFASPCLGAGAAGSDLAASVLREGLIGQVGSQFSQVLVDGVGLIDYLDIRSTGSGSAFGGNTTGNLLYGTEVEIGRYLTSDIFVSATQPFGGLLPGAAVEWTFLPHWRLEFTTEDRARRYSAYGNSLSAFSDRTYRLMLFRTWDF